MTDIARRFWRTSLDLAVDTSLHNDDQQRRNRAADCAVEMGIDDHGAAGDLRGAGHGADQLFPYYFDHDQRQQ